VEEEAELAGQTLLLCCLQVTSKLYDLHNFTGNIWLISPVNDWLVLWLAGTGALVVLAD
jgi:hypothetical protein